MQRFFTDWHNALLAAFTDQAHQAEPAIHLVHLQSNQFADAQPRAVHQFEHAAITQSVVAVSIRTLQQFLHVALGHRLRQAAIYFRRADQCGGIVLALTQPHQVAVVLFQCRQQTRIRSRRSTAIETQCQETLNAGLVGAKQVTAILLQPARKQQKVLLVGGKG